MKDVPEDRWRPPVVLTSALEGTGIDELLGRIDEHRDYLERNGLIAEKRKLILRSRVRNAFMDRMERKVLDHSNMRRILDERMEEVYEGRLSPYELVHEMEQRVTID